MKAEIKERLEQIQRGEVPKGYKKTKLGVIPEEWDICQVKEIASVSSGSTPDRSNREYWNGGIPWVTTGELEKGRVKVTLETVSQNAIIDSNLKVYPKGTLLMAMYGQGKTRGTVAKLCIDAAVNQACAAISVEKGNEDYLFYVLQNSYNEIRKLSNSGNQENLNANIIKSFSVVFPIGKVQKTIAEILEMQDKVIGLKEKLLEEKLCQKKYFAQQLLTGKQRLGRYDGKWIRIKLSEVLSERKEKNVEQTLRICSVAVGKGVVDQVEHLGRSYAAENTSNYGVTYYGDIVYTKSPTGDFPFGIVKQNQIKEKVAVSPLYGIYQPSTYSMGYLLHTYFGYAVNAKNYLIPIIQKGAKNTINISNEVFLSNWLYFPSNEEEIEDLADLFKTVDRQIGLLIQEIDLEKQKKKALMHLLLTGIVRV